MKNNEFDSNKTVIKVSDYYPDNCSEQQFVEVDESVLQAIKGFDKDFESAERDKRRHVVSIDIEDYSAEIQGAFMTSTENIFFGKYDRETVQRILEIFALLTEVQRRRLHKHFKLCMTYEEIGIEEGTSDVAVVKSCISACKRLKRYGKFLQSIELSDWLDLLIYPNLE